MYFVKKSRDNDRAGCDVNGLACLTSTDERVYCTHDQNAMRFHLSLTPFMFA